MYLNQITATPTQSSNHFSDMYRVILAPGFWKNKIFILRRRKSVVFQMNFKFVVKAAALTDGRFRIAALLTRWLPQWKVQMSQ